MSKVGITVEKKDEKDGRRNLIALTEKGRLISADITEAYTDVNDAIEVALNQTQHDLWKAMEEFEFLLNQKSLFQRVQAQRKKRASEKVKIVKYESKYQKHFKKLNEAWIIDHFKMKMQTIKHLDNPKAYILDGGGHIFVALYENQPVGVCALLKM